MKKETIKLIIVFTGISLFGLILTQLFWIRNAIDLAEKQFDHRASMALNDVLEEMVDLNEKNRLKKRKYITEECGNDLVSVVHYIDTSLVDSLLSSYFDLYSLDSIYEFGIHHVKKDSAWTSNAGMHTGPKETRHKIYLSSLFKTKNYMLDVYFPEKRKFIIVSMSAWLFVSVVFLFIVIGSFIFIITAILRQKKLTEIKNDFINNMTHEFKTPIATMTLAAEMLLQNSENKEVNQKYSKIIHDENQRLKSQVERVMQMAKLDKGEFKLNAEEVNIHDLIRSSIDNQCHKLCDKKFSIDYQFMAKNPIIQVDAQHFTNIFRNLIDNANKYSYEELNIKICTKNNDKGVIIQLKDNGIGMTKSTQKHIFDKFYRVPTGNIHNVKGFGLGLNYVKSIIKAHSGTIDVKSGVKKGSTFSIFLPFVQNQ